MQEREVSGSLDQKMSCTGKLEFSLNICKVQTVSGGDDGDCSVYKNPCTIHQECSIADTDMYTHISLNTH